MTRLHQQRGAGYHLSTIVFSTNLSYTYGLKGSKMELDDIKISRTIIEKFSSKLLNSLELDVALVGAGPSNLICGTLLAESGLKVAVFESKLSPGGGMWGGGMMFNEIVIQESALPLMKKAGITVSGERDGYFSADSVEATAALIAGCVKSGAVIFNLIKVVDVMFRQDGDRKSVSGLVLQWSPVDHIDLHVDPLTVRARVVVDGTGHPAEVCRLITDKMDATLDTSTGRVIGEMPMWAEQGENLTIKNSGQIYPGLFVTGMAANAARGAPRMGPIFGGMLLSGEKVAREILPLLK